LKTCHENGVVREPLVCQNGGVIRDAQIFLRKKV